MGVDMAIRRNGSSNLQHYNLTGATGWRTVWLPAAAELGLDLIPSLGDGAFTFVEPEYFAPIVAQLETLRTWMVAHEHELYVEHLDRILTALSEVSLGRDELSFG